MPRKRKVYNASIKTCLKTKDLRVQTESWSKDAIRVNEMELQTESIPILHRSEIDQKKGCVMTRDFLENAYLDFGLALVVVHILSTTRLNVPGSKSIRVFFLHTADFCKGTRKEGISVFRSISHTIFQEQVIEKLNQYHCKTQIFPMISQLNMKRMSWI